MRLDRRRLLRRLGIWLFFPAVLIGTGWATLAFVEGWLGVALWIALSLPLCLLIDVLFARESARSRTAKSLPRMRVRVPLRGSERGQPVAKSVEKPFVWQREPVEQRGHRSSGPRAAQNRRAR